ncbi:MAG: DUF6084 family protein [Bryobacteraceae bacterium]|jgi:uncharacterized protein DUF6084
MPDLMFQITGAQPVRFAATPLLGIDIGISNSGPEQIQTVALRCQIQIEVNRRRYTADDQERLRDLFGEPHRWGQTLRNLLWTHAGVIVPAFSGATQVELQVPCTFDFNVAAVKYFHGVSDGEIPLSLQFSGTVFYEANEGLQVAPISWDKEARLRLPVKLWREMMDLYYPNSAWLCLRRDVFERLEEYKVRTGIPTWEQMLESLLMEIREGVRQ